MEFDKDQMKRLVRLKSDFLETSESKISQLQNKRVLFMDDEDMMREIISSMLMRLGYDFVASQNGSEAINIYQKAMDSKYPFDAVILDLKVRVGLGGLETIKALKAMDPWVKAIVSSGLSNDPVMICFKEYGFLGALPKPYKMKDIEDELYRLIV